MVSFNQVLAAAFLAGSALASPMTPHVGIPALKAESEGKVSLKQGV